MQKIESNVQPIIWQENKLILLDQRFLPYEKKYLELTSYKQVIKAIQNMTVRGAPLIGICAAYGMALAAYEFVGALRETPQLINKLNVIAEEIKSSRPTAINLKWAIDLVLNDIVGACHGTPNSNGKDVVDAIVKRAIWIHKDDADRCQKIGEYGVKIVETLRATSLLTICNTGSLATGGIGTAFGVILTAHMNGQKARVYVSETRPRQQGARLTTFECAQNGIDCTLISDTACGHLMKKGEVDLVIAGADRIAANGDSANKIGTYQLAVLAGENKIPFYIAAPLSTFDLSIKSGDEIPIEERDEKEVTNINGKPICADGVKARNPAFDVTPAKYITGIITERGILSGDYRQVIKNVFNEVVVA